MKNREEKHKGTISKIRGIIPSLNSAERKIAKYIIGHPEDILYQSVNEVANKSDVSEATVVRFARKIGFRGFQDLKISMAREMVSPIKAIHQDLMENDTDEDIVKKVFNSNIQALHDSMSITDFSEYSRAADAIVRANRVLIIGVGTSSPITMDAYNKLLRLGINCRAQTDGHLQVMEASLLKQGDVIIAISHSGSTLDPIQTLKVAKNAGATAICITNNSLSPITKIADIKLLTASRETKFRTEAMSSRIAQTTIIDSLYTLVAFRNKKKASESIKKIEDAIVIKQY